MTENRIVQDVIYLVSCAVNETVPEPDRVYNMNLPAVYALAEKHMLTAAVALALESTGFRDAMSTKAISESVRRTACFDSERSSILRELEEAGIWYLPLKGCVLKDCYPKIGMRQMADNDILYDVSRSEDLRNIMERLGFSTDNNYGRGVHDHYFKPPVCNFEMHRMLFGVGHDQQLVDYYHDVKKRLLPDEGRNYGYHFSDEDFYIYMIAHEYKHYSSGGTGLRSLLDTWVYLRKVPLDMAFVAGEIEKLGIADFEAANRSLALHLFGGEPLTEGEQEMLEYVLSSGTYGTMANRIRRQLREKGRWGYFLSRMTLPFDMMTQLYPVLGRIPLLYPFCWAHRLIHAFFFRHKVFMYQLKSVLTWKE